MNSSVPWENERSALYSETSTPYSHYSGIPSIINNSPHSSLDEANIIESINEKDSLFNVLNQKINDKNFPEKWVEIDKNFGEGCDIKAQGNILADIFSWKEAIKTRNLPDFAFKNHVRLDDLLKNCNQNQRIKETNSKKTDNSNDFNKIMNVIFENSSTHDNQRVLDKNKSLKKESNFISGSILNEIENMGKSKNSNQSLLSLLNNNNNVENDDKKQSSKKNEQSKSCIEKRKSNKIENLVMYSDKKCKNKKKEKCFEEEKNLKNYSPIALVKENNVNKIEFRQDTLPKRMFHKERKFDEGCPLKFNKLKLVLNKVNFSSKKIINS